MATLTVTCADADMPRVIAALCAQANVPNNAANAQAALIQIINNAIVGAETAAHRAALEAMLADPPQIVPPTITVT